MLWLLVIRRAAVYRRRSVVHRLWWLILRRATVLRLQLGYSALVRLIFSK